MTLSIPDVLRIGAAEGPAFRIADAPTAPPKDAPSTKKCEAALEDVAKKIDDWQQALYAEDRNSVLCIFQAMDAAGKDGTIRAVTKRLNPAGFQVHSFKAPSYLELEHDFLWRTTLALPQRGRIGVFNRSYYEEVLVVRVHPAYVAGQRVAGDPADPAFWEHRYRSIREHEGHLHRNGTRVLKFFLHVSKEEQRKRLLSRLDTPDKNWKFNPADLDERDHWLAYMDAWEACVRATASDEAPWWVVPADDKPFMRMRVAQILEGALAELAPRYPELDADTRERLPEFRRRLEAAD